MTGLALPRRRGSEQFLHITNRISSTNIGTQLSVKVLNILWAKTTLSTGTQTLSTGTQHPLDQNSFEYRYSTFSTNTKKLSLNLGERSAA